MSLSNDINTTSTALSDIKDAIIAKGVTPSGNITTYATAISQISGGSAVIDSLSITPTTSAQTITASGGVDGYSPINVSAVTSSIDANITAGNIKNGVTILGVTGDYTGSGSATLITKSITQNGTYNASSDNADGYSSVTVNVSGGGGYSEIPSYQISNGVAVRRSGALTGNEFSGITSVGVGALSYAFESCSSLTGTLDLSSLTSIGNFGLQYAFSGCSSLTSVDLSSLTSVGNFGLYYAFNNCSGLTGTLDLSSLQSVDESALYSAFQGCSSLTSVDLASLTSVGNSGLNSAFPYCSGLTSVDLLSLTSVGDYGLNSAFNTCEALTGALDLPLLTTVGDYGLKESFMFCSGLTSVNLSSLQSVGSDGLNSAFSDCGLTGTVDFSSLTSIGTHGLNAVFANTMIEHIYFRALKSDSFADDTVFGGMLANVSGATVHFPSNLQSVIGSWSSVTSGFDGESTTVLFDLTATE